MAKAFDPSAFIAAEQAVAAPASDWEWSAAASKPAENCQKQSAEMTAIAALAAIAGPDGKCTPWAHEVAGFIARPCPRGIPDDHWDEIVGECELIERRWGIAAYEAGWTVLDLYGCPPEPLARRHGQSGLVHALVAMTTPLRIIGLDRSGAVLCPGRGAPMRYRPPPRLGAVCLWEAYL